MMPLDTDEARAKEPRPYRLRLLLDVELTESEWITLAQANLPGDIPERRLAVMVWDSTLLNEAEGARGACGEAERPSDHTGEVLALVAARPASLLMKPPPLDPPVTLEESGFIAAEDDAPRLPDVLEDGDDGPVA